MHLAVQVDEDPLNRGGASLEEARVQVGVRSRPENHASARDEPDPAEDAMEFWETTNRQDWHICEMAHLGQKTVAYDQGRYSTEEDTVHAIDQYYLHQMGLVGDSDE